jgi:hypothetical protein
MIVPLRFLVDEDFDHTILRGVSRRAPSVDLVTVQEAGLSGKHDTVVLELAANENRIVLTHDVSTMETYANARVAKGQGMPGVFTVSQALPVGLAIEAILLVALCSHESEWEGLVLRLPIG